MAKILAAVLWPAGLAAIVAAAALLTRHLPAAAKVPSARVSGPRPVQGRDADATDDPPGRRPHVPGFDHARATDGKPIHMPSAHLAGYTTLRQELRRCHVTMLGRET